jgi:polyisoprenoid-binding protein YceI
MPSGVQRLGPHNATLLVRTGRSGAAAKAGHDLVMHVTSWEAELELAEDPAATTMLLAADGTSLRVQHGHGGMNRLGDEDKASIHQSIDEEVLKREDITFRSTRVTGADGRLDVRGELTIVGRTQPIDFDLHIGADGTLSATAVVTQSAWGLKPYSILFGALKVADDVEIELDGHVPA